MTTLLIELHYIMINLKPFILSIGGVIAFFSFVLAMK